MEKILNEGLNHKDFVDQILPTLGVDEYAAKMGGDDEVVTLSFTVKSRAAGDDLSDWFERGYDWVLDAQTSEGEVKPNRWLVFVEVDRRRSVPDKIIQLLTDLETLCDLTLDDWTVEIDDDNFKVDVNTLKEKMILSPHLYREKHGDDKDESINEMRSLSGIEHKKKYNNPDSLLKDFVSKAGL